MNKKRARPQVISQIIMIVTSFTILFPMYFMCINSFKSRQQYLRDPLGWPSPLTFENFVSAFSGKDFVSWFVNSTILTVASSAITMFIALLAGYAFAKMHFKGRDTLFRCIVPLMSVPPVAMLIPLFRMVSAFRMVNSLSSVILIYCGICLPMTIYMIRNFLISVPDSILEAARIDGCSRFRMLFSVIMPLSVPAIVTSGLVNIVWVWNELLIALVFLQKESLRTLVVGVTVFKSRYNLNIPVIMAGLMVVTIPMLLVYIFGQKKLVQGLMSGAVKE
mgnify:CR=1 FL=1